MLKLKPYKLINTIQHYEWGTKGKNAFIPKLLNIKAGKDKPYAELWMGAHPKASSKIIIDGNEIELLKAIKKYSIEMLGRKTAKQFSNTLPFLFKVLSASEALSIQVHPNKKRAIALHKKDPVNYPDANQKLEIAIALDSLTALVGFRPLKQIIKTFQDYPEIVKFIGERFINSILIKNLKTVKTIDMRKFNIVLGGINPAENGNTNIPMNRFNGLQVLSEDAQKKFARNIFSRLLKESISNEEGLKAAIENLYKRLAKNKNQTEIDKYFLELSRKFKNDIGLLILFFLNLVHLKRGEAIFTKPGIPHAYLKGNILECMSNSDNVIRAGLTPKHKDIDSLLKVLRYDLSYPKILRGKKTKNSFVYKTDAKEFEVQIFTSNKNELKFDNQVGPRILLVLEGAIKFLFMNGAKTKSEKILKGESVLLPSILSNFKIIAEKTSRFVLVSVPRWNN
jgi:mannose-6-phosphate isomerase